MPVTDTWEKLSTESVLKGYSSPIATAYVGLGTGSFSTGTSDEALGEVLGQGYQRIPVQWTDFVADMSNSGTLVWSAGATWGTVSYVFVSDSFQGGAVLLHDLVPSRNVASGDTVTIEIGGLILT